MDDSEATSLEQIQAFLAGSGEVRFAGQRREEVYFWTEQTLVRHRYTALKRREKGLLRRYVARMTGLSRAQVTRLIASYIDSGRVKAAVYQRTKFATRYTKSDVELLAYVDKSHANLSGPATKRHHQSRTRLGQISSPLADTRKLQIGLTAHYRLDKQMIDLKKQSEAAKPARSKKPCRPS